MHKGILVIAAGTSLFGLLILGTCMYHCFAYGNGDPEIGNFHRYEYAKHRDPITHEVSRDWVDPPTGEGSQIAFVDMWAVGLFFLALGPGILALEHSSRDKGHSG
jgi:hypothetical protein